MHLSNYELLSSNQYIRDLAWIFSTAPIVKLQSLSFEQNELDADWLEVLNKAPEKINTFMATKNLKMLGPYFEALWEFYLSHYPGKQLIAKNVQVFDSNKTIGEFDFIYYDEQLNQYRHLEVAIKYYLGIDTDSATTSQFTPMKNWLGPNLNDRLDKKFSKMRDFQAQLSQTIAGRSALEKLNINEIKSEVCLLGYLFHPAKQPLLAPEFSSPLHNRAIWLHLNQIDELFEYDNLWLILEKPHWMASISKPFEHLMTQKQIINQLKLHFLRSTRPLLVSNFKTAGGSGKSTYHSNDKYFVVPDSWPATSS